MGRRRRRHNAAAARLAARHQLLPGFASSLLGDGGVGKTALRYAQMLSLATRRPLTGEYVFQRCRVLILSLEDGPDELRRRMRAARLHHGIEHPN